MVGAITAPGYRRQARLDNAQGNWGAALRDCKIATRVRVGIADKRSCTITGSCYSERENPPVLLGWQ